MRPEQVPLVLTLEGDRPAAIMAFVTRGLNRDGSVQFERELTDAAVRFECVKAGLPLASWRVLTEELPPRDYRDAWVDRGGRIEHDMPRAREIHRAKLRTARAPLLADLDVEYQRADEAGDQKAKRSVAARKQALRDAPADPRIEAAQTVDELASIRLG